MPQAWACFQRVKVSCPKTKSEQKELQEVCCSPSPWFPAPGCAVIPTLSQDLPPFPAAWLATLPCAVTIFCSFDSLNA